MTGLHLLKIDEWVVSIKYILIGTTKIMVLLCFTFEKDQVIYMRKLSWFQEDKINLKVFWKSLENIHIIVLMYTLKMDT